MRKIIIALSILGIIFSNTINANEIKELKWADILFLRHLLML